MRTKDIPWFMFLCLACQSTGTKAPMLPTGIKPEAQVESHREPSGTETVSPPMGPLMIESPVEHGTSPSPKQQAIRLVLSPAKAQAFAYIGALEALRKKGIAIKSITAVGLGGLLASLFAFSKSANQLEWQLTKLPADTWETKSWISLQPSLQVPTSWQKHLMQFLKDKHPALAPIPVMLPLRNGMDAGVCDLARNLSLFTGELVRAPCPELAWQEVQMESQLDALIRASDATTRGEPLLILQTRGKEVLHKGSPWTIGLGIEEDDWETSRFQSRQSLQYRGRNAVVSQLTKLETLILETP